MTPTTVVRSTHLKIVFAGKRDGSHSPSKPGCSLQMDVFSVCIIPNYRLSAVIKWIKYLSSKSVEHFDGTWQLAAVRLINILT